ncbi:MAG: protein kinase [Chthoniobacterales bacterium]|nr:protein kinase [Chthoniobacterales bacterium]
MAKNGIETLPQSCPACGTIVNVIDVEPLARVTCPRCGEKFRVERAFDHFELVETLGVGGMGSVYKARDTRLNRFVALKLLRKELSADPAEAARLEQEARLTAAVNHPNVVQVYSSGTAHGQIYLVMELVDHGNLDDLMAEQTRVPEARVLATAIQVARGLQAAHERGLIHRDVKPANILFADAQAAKIGDFGLAVAAGQNGEAQLEIWGTPYYVAPERLDNEPEDFRSDIYSLGATLFHALAGQPPIEGESTSAAALRELKSHPPDLRQVAPEISGDTARIVARMIAPAPGDRFASYAELIDELQRAYHPFSGEPNPTVLRRWWVAALVCALALVVAAGVYVVRERRAAKSSIATASKESEEVAVLQRRYGEARQQLILGNYDAAAKAFTQLSADAHDKQPLLNWIGLHRGLAALLQNNPKTAREAFQTVERAANFSSAPADAHLVRFFSETGRFLAADSPAAPVSATADLKANSADAFGLFLIAAKSWQAAQYAEAVPLLERFVATESAGQFAWINDYKPLARKFLADYGLFSEWKQQPQTFANSTEMSAAATRLRALERKLQTRGALAVAMKADEKRLSAELRRRRKAEKSATAATAQDLAEESPVWNAAAAEARTKIAAYDFAGALEAIKAVDVTAPSLKEAEAAETKRVEWLLDWKARLIADLHTGRYTATVSDVPSVEYQGVADASESEITLRIPGGRGAARVKWQVLTPKTLLAMSVAFIAAHPNEAADRQWLAAVFAHATGQGNAARTLSEAAVKAKPQYREHLKILAPAP